MIAILLAPVYLLANYYLLRRVMGWVKAWFPFFRTARHWALPVAVQAFLACSIVIAFFLPEGRARRVMKLIGNYWLGVLLYVLLAVIAADLLRLLLGYVLPFKHIFVTTQMHRIAGCVCALVILIASIWGVVNARIIHVTPYDVTVDKTVEGMDEMKVVLVADLHLGYNIGEKQMQQMVDRINEQDADLVVIAGDIFDNEWEAVEAPETIAATLRSIRSKYGVYACYGNHDIEEPVLAGFTFRQSEKKESDPRMDEFLKDANITLLRDEGMLIDGKFYLYGRPDAHRPGRGIETRKTPDEITAGLDKDKPIIVLDHQPKELQELADAGVDIDLCGHTHDGQMFPGNLTIKLMWKMPAGISKRERCTTSSPPASACSDPTCAWGQKQRFVRLPSILHKCKALCGTCAAGIAAPKALHESKGPFSFTKENGPFGTPRERLRLAVLGSKGLFASGMQLPAWRYC